MIIYDCEIKVGVLGRNEMPKQGVKYCGGWSDFKGMGVSVACAYDYGTDRYRVFMDDNADELRKEIERADCVAGFNNQRFDDPLIKACWQIEVPRAKSYDLLIEAWRACGLGPTFVSQTHGGFSLDAVSKINFPHSVAKTGAAILAPILYQEGKIGELIDYCLQDVKLTKQLMDRVLSGGELREPKRLTSVSLRHPGEFITLRND